MKCFKPSSTEAVAFCVWCGRTVCRDCAPTSPTARVVCSETCRADLERESKTLSMLLEKSNQTARANAFYYLLAAGLSAGGAVAAWFWLPSPFLIGFTGACALVMFVAGIWHGRVAKKSRT